MSKWESGIHDTAEWVRGRPCGNSGQGKRFGLNDKCVERHQKDLALISLPFYLQFPVIPRLWDTMVLNRHVRVCHN